MKNRILPVISEFPAAFCEYGFLSQSNPAIPHDYPTRFLLYFATPCRKVFLKKGKKAANIFYALAALHTLYSIFHTLFLICW